MSALSEISRGLKASTITILNVDNNKSTQFNEFIMEIHRFSLQTCIFNDTRKFFKFIDTNLKGSVEVTAIIFHNPEDLIPQVRFAIKFWSFVKFLILQIHEENLAHRLSLYIFFWNAKSLSSGVKNCNLKEPLRAVMITNPRKFVYRIYYNQATSSNDGTLKLVNWFDGNNLGLNSEPVLFHVKNIYENFNERVFIVPVVHVWSVEITGSPSINLMNSDILSESTLDIHKLHQQQFNGRFYWPNSTIWKWLWSLVWSERKGRFIAKDSGSEDEF